MTVGNMRFRRYGMPFLSEPRARASRRPGARAGRSSPRACSIRHASSEVFRALQLGWFTTTLVLDEDEDIARALEPVGGLDVAGGRRGDRRRGARSRPTRPTSGRRAPPRAAPRTSRARRARPTGRCAIRRPSLVFESADGRRLEAGGFQPIEAYDVLIANLDPTCIGADRPRSRWRRSRASPAASSPRRWRRSWRTTTRSPTVLAAERALIELLGAGEVRRTASRRATRSGRSPELPHARRIRRARGTGSLQR